MTKRFPSFCWRWRCWRCRGLASAQKTLRIVMHSDIKILDPIWTTAFIVRNHGYMVYDTLFALDGDLKIKPEMVDTWTVSMTSWSGPSRCATGSLSPTANP